MSDKKILDLENKKDIDKELYVPISDKDGNNYSYDISKLASKEKLEYIEKILNTSVNPEAGQIIYTTYDDKPITLDNEVVKSNEYYPSKGYGIITLSTTDKIPDNLIKNQNNLKTITVSGTFKTIGNAAISSNYNLQQINLEDGIVTLEASALEKNKTLSSIYLPDSITSMGNWALCGNDNLQSVRLPKNLKEISEGLFDVDSTLLTVTIPDSVTKIGAYAFEECYSLFSLNIPNSVTSIGEGVFSNCINLQVLNLGGIKGNISNFLVGCSSIREVIIPEGVTSITDNFCSNTNLDLLVIPSTVTTSKQNFWEATCKKIDFSANVTKIGYSAATNPGLFVLPVAKELEELILRNNSVISGVDTYLTTKIAGYDGKPLSKLKIYVPETLVENYKTTYPKISHRFFPITGEQTVYAYQDDTYTKEEVDNKIDNIDIPEVDLSEIESKLEGVTKAADESEVIKALTILKDSDIINIVPNKYNKIGFLSNDKTINYTSQGTSGLDLSVNTDIIATKEDLKNIDNQPFIVVDSLPDKPEEGNENKIHLVLIEDNSEENNKFAEYIWVNDSWEKLGEVSADVDLSEYAKADKVEAIEGWKNNLISNAENNNVVSWINSTFNYISGKLRLPIEYINLNTGQLSDAFILIPDATSTTAGVMSVELFNELKEATQNISEIKSELENKDDAGTIEELTSEEVKDIFIPKPTIYYTTTDNNQISDDKTGLQDYIISHTKETNGEWKIVLDRDMTSIPDKCFYQQHNIQTIRFEGLDDITSVGNNFLYYCNSLQSINLLPLSNVESIGINFLYFCQSLHSIDLTPLNKITSIGNNFLNGCPSLQSIDLSPLSNIESIGDYFLYGCLKLTLIDFTPLNQVTSIGKSLLSGCSSINILIMPNTTDITSIGSAYLSGCSKLTTIYCPKGTLEHYKQLMPDRASIMVEMN